MYYTLPVPYKERKAFMMTNCGANFYFSMLFNKAIERLEIKVLDFKCLEEQANATVFRMDFFTPCKLDQDLLKKVVADEEWRTPDEQFKALEARLKAKQDAIAERDNTLREIKNELAETKRMVAKLMKKTVTHKYQKEYLFHFIDYFNTFI